MCATDNTTAQLLDRSGGNFQATSYLNQAGGATTYIDLLFGNVNFSNAAGIGYSGFEMPQNANSTSVNKFVNLRGGYYNGSGITSVNASGIRNGGQGAIDGFQLGCGTGNIPTGSIKIFGRRNGL